MIIEWKILEEGLKITIREVSQKVDDKVKEMENNRERYEKIKWQPRRSHTVTIRVPERENGEVGG